MEVEEVIRDEEKCHYHLCSEEEEEEEALEETPHSCNW